MRPLDNKSRGSSSRQSRSTGGPGKGVRALVLASRLLKEVINRCGSVRLIVSRVSSLKIAEIVSPKARRRSCDFGLRFAPVKGLTRETINLPLPHRSPMAGLCHNNKGRIAC